MTKNHTKGIFLGGALTASVAWSGLVLVFLANGWWTWVLAGLAWAYAASTAVHVLRKGVRIPSRKTAMVPTMTMTSPNKSTGQRST